MVLSCTLTGVETCQSTAQLGSFSLFYSRAIYLKTFKLARTEARTANAPFDLAVESPLRHRLFVVVSLPAPQLSTRRLRSRRPSSSRRHSQIPAIFAHPRLVAIRGSPPSSSPLAPAVVFCRSSTSSLPLVPAIANRSFSRSSIAPRPLIGARSSSIFSCL